MFFKWLGSNSATRSSSQGRSASPHCRIFSMKRLWRLFQTWSCETGVCFNLQFVLASWEFLEMTTVYLVFTAQVYRTTNKRLRCLFTTFPSRFGDYSRKYGTSIKFVRSCVPRTGSYAPGRKTWDFLTVVPVKALCCRFNRRFFEYQSDTLIFRCLCAIFNGK